jgi:3alpha(or 20beta)-hydroxysteroid dehydrogenase
MGSSHARVLASRGANVVIADILEEEGRALAQEIGSRALYCQLDVANAESWAQAIADTEKTFGAISALVNNAALAYAVPFDELTEAEYRKFIDVNQIGVFLGMKAVAPSMRTAGGGSIINISSTAGLRGANQIFAYVGTKFAVTGMTKAAAVDLGADNIRVNSVHPGLIDTKDMHTYRTPILERTPLQRVADVREVSNLIAFLVSDESSFCTGAEFVIDGGLICRQ